MGSLDKVEEFKYHRLKHVYHNRIFLQAITKKRLNVSHDTYLKQIFQMGMGNPIQLTCGIDNNYCTIRLCQGVQLNSAQNATKKDQIRSSKTNRQTLSQTEEYKSMFSNNGRHQKLHYT